MTLVQRAVVLVMVVMAAVQVSYAAVHKVGDSAGWTILGNVDYKKWAAPKNFQVGDTIIFEYNAQFHNVMRVTHAMYKTCNASSPIATFSTGNDSIKITNHGHHFFFCGVPGHCQAGQKVDINVISVSAATAAAPTPTPAPSSPSSSLATPSANVPAPSPNNATPLIVLKGLFGTMGLAMAVLALFSSYA
ncbi:mavicyanin-like [Lotus japonicus]|uniref:Phytocyanin domain-containing protein n=1 Tax=Lotus japonicus TaxID=34305 RepID=I3T2Y6_LOTJA|nr:mavicyanin-like [Lotus japonicus]AFK46878.1 unknown [Lotus japonicus]